MAQMVLRKLLLILELLRDSVQTKANQNHFRLTRVILGSGGIF